ncbi:MAG: hypothetical protein A3F10_06225 [Coxiella sp. RIFCSPHIGHO2_12_FULL_42_15]|nr:MAG: hypothetical protein A3F10_06225 [Coxiella sp. RIFCSPHIGHO2_12_FULL_42_15]
MRSSGISKTTTSRTVSSSGFMNKVYLFMTLGLLVSAAIAYYFHIHPLLTRSLMASPILFYGVVFAQLGAVLLFSRMVTTLNTQASFILFFVYAALTGVTFGMISFAYTAQNIGYAFAITAGSFLGLSVIGYTTKKDLSPIGSFCMMGLIGLVIESLLAIFIPGLRGNTIELAMAAIGVLVFSGLTAYHTQKIKNMGYEMQNQEVAAINGAFILYLDFINLFLSILRFFGNRR